MLPAANRLRDGDTFRAAVRGGAKAGARTVVVHLWAQDRPAPTRVGLVVSRAVGPAVTRNLVKRRLRHLLRSRLHRLPEGSVLVVRALPAAARAPFSTLDEELTACLDRLQRRGAMRAET